MQALDGGFGDTNYTTIGDDYDKVKVRDARSKGLNFVTTGSKKGKGPEVTFSKEFLSLHQGDRYIDPGTAERKERMAKAAKRIVASGFKYSNPPKNSNGSGTYFGTFQEANPLPHETDYVVLRKGQHAKRHEFAPRNIVTAQPKHGTYGFNKTTLSDIGLNYIADFYDAARTKARSEAVAGKQKMPPVPFKSAGTLGTTFDANKGSGISQVYTMTKAMPPRKPVISKASVAREGVSAWRPNNFKVNYDALEYREDPYELRDQRDKQNRVKNTPAVPWKPVSVSKSRMTRSIAFAGLKV
eukprot:PhM_4_TR8611/c0_g1_i1/m.64299